jgi:hypothetical protein
MAGFRLIDNEIHRDERGRLMVFEQGGTLPFVPVRTFTISDVPAGKSRAGHSVSCDLMLTCLRGSCLVVLGLDLADRVQLSENGRSLLLQQGTWLRLEDFAPGTLLLVHASKRFSQTHYDSGAEQPSGRKRP